MMKRKIITVLLIISIISTCVCGGVIYRNYREDVAADAALEEIQEMKPVVPDTDSNVTEEQLPLMEFDTLKESNSDIIAWLTVPDTKIDYPIVQAKDNDFYLLRDVKKRSNKNGTLFLDYHANAGFIDFNNVIYGHHMESGKMFQNLIKFKEKTFWDATLAATLYTSEYTYRLEFFAVAVVRQDSKLYEYVFESPSDREAHIANIYSEAKFSRDIGMTERDRIIALSTCSYEFKDARTIVFARLGE